MLKIALLFLLCAISGYGINGLPDKTSVSIQAENNKLQPTVVRAANLNDTNTNDKTTASQLSLNSSTVIPSKIVTEVHRDTIASNKMSVENAFTNIPMNKSLPITAKNFSEAITEDMSTTFVTPTESPTTIASLVATIPTISSLNDPLKTTVMPPTTTEVRSMTVSPPKAGKWVVNETNQTCIVINMAVQFNISYVDKANETVSNLFNLPDSNNDTVVTGECGKLEQYIRLSFNDIKNGTTNFTLYFIKNETKNQYSLHHYEVILLNPNDTVVFEHDATPLISAGLSNSYRCLKQQNFTLAQNGSDKITGYFLISDLQFQAFKMDNNKDFGQVQDCKLETPDIVPIAVGCALAGLVVIVLIAYLMGRRRSQGRGYLSM